MFGGDGSTFVDLYAAAATAGSDPAGGFTVPAEFLFHGEYKRAGNDLKIIGEHGKAFVVHDYFKTGQLHTLFAPGGAALTGDIVAALAGPLAPGQYAQATPPQGAAQAIGRVATEQGSAIAVRNGVTVALNVGDVVLKGDVIQTQGGSAVGIIFSDGTTFNLGANARMVLNEFVYDPSPGSANSALINLVQGSITFVAGQVAHTGDMKVGTPSATMGIRGTAVQVDIDVNNGTTKMSVLVEPGGRVGEFLVYSLAGQLIATVDNANNQTTVTPAGTATSIAKTPAEIAQALTLVQQVFQTQAVGQAILAAQPLPGNNSNQNNQAPDPNSQPHDQNNQPLQKQNSTPPQTQIASTDVSSSHVTVNVTQTPTDTAVVVQPVPANPQSLPLALSPPPPPPPPPPTQPAGLGVVPSSAPALVEAAGGLPGNSASVAVLTVTGGNTATFDTSKLLTDNWNDAGNGVYTKDGVYGMAVLSTSVGTLSYTLDNNSAVTHSLAAGEVQHDVFTIPVTDGTATANGTVSFEIDGRNDAPVLAKAADFSFENGLSGWLTAGQVTQVLGGTDGTHAAQLETAGLAAVSVNAIETFLGLSAGTLAAINAGGNGNTIPMDGSALAMDFDLHAGQTLTFDWDFSTTDYSPFKDFAFYSVSNGVIKLSDVFIVGDYGNSGWHTATFTALTDGTYLFGFGVLDAGDTALASDLLIDNVQVSTFTAYTENQAPTVVNPTAIVSDVDNTTLVGATVAITGGFHSGQDVLGFVDQNGIHGAYNAGTGVLTLTGVASLANYQAALQTVTYFNSSDNPSADTRTINFQVNDGSAENNLSNVGVATVAVTPVNDAPTLVSPAIAEVTQNAGVQTFTAAGLLLALNAHDAEGDVLKIVNLALLGPDGNPIDLNNPPSGVTVSLAGDGSLISFSVDAGNFKSLNAGQHVTLTANFTVSDGNGGFTPASAQLIVDGVNDAPVTTNAAVTTSEDIPYVFQLSDFPFADPNDSPANSLASVVITSLTQPPGSTLTLNGSPVALNTPIAASEIAAGHLVFTEAANGNGGNYASFAFAVVDNGGTANGGQNTSSAATMAINVTPVNDAPGGTDNAVATTVNQAYTFQAADFGFSDPNDTPANTLLAVEITTLPGSGTLTDNGTAVSAGQFVSAADISSGQLVFTPAANASGSTSFSFQVQDNGDTANGGVNLDPTPNSITVNVGVVTPVNSAPSGADNAVTTNEDQAYTFHAADFGFSDPNNAPPNSLLAVEITTLPASGTLTDHGIGVSAGQFVSVADINASQLVFTPAANASGSTSFSFQVQDNGGTANVGVNLDPTPNTITVNVTPVNDAPVANANGGGLAYIENQAATAIDTALTLSDVDSANVAGATVSITGNFAAGQDVLGFTNQNGISSSYNGGVLTLSGSSSLANYQAALRSVTYFDSSDNPSALARTISFQVNDGAAANNLSNVVTANVTVAPVNDAPAANANGGGLAYTENQAATAIDTALTLSDVDSANLSGATVSIATNFAAGQDVLGFTDQNGISGSYNGGVLTLSGSSSLANYQAALRSVTYFDSSDNPSALPRTISFQVNDGAAANNLSNVVTANVTVTPVNDATVVNTNGGGLAYTENQAATAIDTALTLSDVDSANLAGATVSITGNFAAGQDVLGFTNQNGISSSYNGGVLTLSGSSSLANYQAALRSVTYFNSSDNPSGLARTVSFQVNDGAAVNNLSNVVTANVTVTPVNDAPVIQNVGGTVQTSENVSVRLYAPNGTVTDVDAGVTDLVLATLKVTSGTLTPYANVPGVTIVNGQDGSNGTLSFTGILTDITTAIDSGVMYLPTPNYVGADQLTLTVNDQGHTGSGGPQTTTATVGITVASGTVIITGGQTVEVAGASSALTASYIGAGGTLQTDAAVTGGASAGISATSTDGAALAITALGGATSTGADAIDANNSGGAGDITVAANGMTTGAANGIKAIQQGGGDVSVTTGANTTIAAAALFGIEAQSFGSGRVSVTTAVGDQINSASTGIHAENFATAIPQSAKSAIVVTAYGGNANGDIKFGWVVPSGGHPRGILAWYAGDAAGVGTPNSNVFGDVTVNNYANIMQNYDSVPADAGDGIGAFNYGIGKITVNDGTLNAVPGGPGTSINVARYGIIVQAYQSNQVTVSMAPGDSIVSGSAGIFAFNGATAIDALADSKITITADGTITSGQISAVGGNAAGIIAGYNGAINGPFVPNLAVTGTVLISNNANITAAAGWGIDAYNYGNGNVTVNDTAQTVSGAQTGIGAYQYSGGTGELAVTVAAGSTVTGVAGDAIDANTSNGGSGDVSVMVGANATITGGLHGIFASSVGSGNILIGTAVGDTVNAASRALYASNNATAIDKSAASTIEVDAYGSVNFGSTLTAGGNRPRAIFAAYNGDASNTGMPNLGVSGDVIVNNYANLKQTPDGNPAHDGDGIAAFNDGIGNVTVKDGTLNDLGVQGTSINVARFGIDATSYESGKITVSTVAGDSIISGNSAIQALNQATAIDAATPNTSTIAVDAYGTLTTTSATASSAIFAAYAGVASGNFAPNAAVHGDIVVTNYADITAANNSGIQADNYGVGDVTVIDGTWNNVSIASGGRGTKIGTEANPIPRFGILADNYFGGNVTVSMAPGDSIVSKGTGIDAGNQATPASNYTGTYAIKVTAYGTIHSGTVLNGSGNLPAGIVAFYGGAATNNAFIAGVTGNVDVENYSMITSDGGDGIRAFTAAEHGDIIVNDGVGTTIAAARYGINAGGNSTGSINVSVAAGDQITSGQSGITATSSAVSIGAAAGSTITVTAAGTINSGSSGNSSNWSSGINAGYSGGNGLSNTTVNGAVIVNNSANITETYGNGINTFNYGQGDVTVNDSAGTITAAQVGIYAGQLSGGTGNVTINIGASANVTGPTGVAAIITGSGLIDIINLGTISGSGAQAIYVSQANNNVVTVDNYGTINGSIVFVGGAYTLALNRSGTVALGGKSVSPGNAGETFKNNGNTITGAGGQIGDGSGHLALNNAAGTIEALGGTLTINTGSTVVNAGTLEAASGATLQINDHAITNTGSIKVEGTLLVLSASAITLTGGGTVMLSNGTISGTGGASLTNTDNTISGFGQIGLGNPNVLNLTNAAAGTIEAIGGTLTIKINTSIENAGLLEAASGATLQINVGTVHNTGNIDVYGTLAAAQPTANGGMLKLTGGGNTTLIGGTITTPLSGETLENGANTIAGYGQIGDGIVSLNLQNDAAATIDANAAGHTLIVHTGNVITNNGTLEANGGTLHIVDAVTGAGSAMITGGGTLQIDATYAQTVTFSGIGGTLLLHGASTFSGIIAGISGSADVLDLFGFDNAATFSYSGTSSSGTLTVSEGATTVHLNVAGTNMGAFVKAGLDSSGTGLLIHDPAADPAEQHHVADGTLDGAAASDTIDVTSQGNYPGVLTVSPNGNGGADWHFAASDNDIAQQAGQTQNYMVQDLTTPSASQALSVSIGGSGQDQFQFSSGSGAHALVDFSTSSDASGHYAGDTVNLINFSNDHGGSLTLNDILADLTTDSHGNAVVNLGHGDSIVFEHISASVILSQVDQGHPVFTLGVNQA